MMNENQNSVNDKKNHGASSVGGVSAMHNSNLLSDNIIIENDDNYEFNGATLKLDNPSSSDSSSVTLSTNVKNSSNPMGADSVRSGVNTGGGGGGGVTTNTPSVTGTTQPIPAQRTVSTASSSGTPEKPRIGSARHFFSFRPGQFELAIKDCDAILLRPLNDTDLKGYWLLTEISHWDHERERIVLLTSKTLYVVKYDFIAMRILANFKYKLNTIDTIVRGKLTYPPSSFAPKRQDIGVKIMWNKGQPISTWTSWNPFASNIPWKIFTDHPLFDYQDTFNSPYKIQEELDKHRKFYSLDNLYEILGKLFSTQIIDGTNVNHNCEFKNDDILLENYVGIGAVIHNKNNFGFFKVRGKFSF